MEENEKNQSNVPVADDRCTLFQGSRIVARGSLREMVIRANAFVSKPNDAPLVLLRDLSAEMVEWNGPLAKLLHEGHPEPLSEVTDEAKVGRGRPKLGVTAREVTLLPRHWEWLEKNPSGASAKLREIVEASMRVSKERERRRSALEAVERFMNAVAGNLPGAEEVSRALYAVRMDDVRRLTESWPGDVRSYYLELAERTVTGV